MGILSVVNMCSHLQNASKARLGLTSVPNTKYNLRFAMALHRAGLISSVTRAGPTPPPPEALLTFEAEPVTTANVASRRLWLGLKYWENKPVMQDIEPISKSSRLVQCKLPGLEKLIRGFDHGYIKGLYMGESLFVGTSCGVLEAREAVEKRVGGLVLCRIK
ncbi:mitochondrial 37S ribosomal protein S8 [Gaeumannomyces tritici R3-111a-1]|uniref:Mitochondrial 37S ribosomal protein S8 n=1 Tax=Gaeumannomyces tritici (strain R3-111a-1) TaxID=644352 RepID=J3NK46_GAET3|nr:mitochondrial 37S ribosomal protein S8 [Gaeumannomyces tritici R3-111a-1]EJT81650.1 mitochondrial 37S ribosomal protein S8 [Gaeumannomyces tritici R3-111a-1]